VSAVAAPGGIETRPPFTMRMRVETQAIGPAGGTAERRVVVVTECVVEGERIRGRVLPGASDWVSAEPDGVVRLDCRMVARTDDGALVGMSYRGLRHGPPEAMAALARGEAVDTSGFYHRVAILFETSAERYRWLNRVLAVGRGTRTPEGGVYEVFEVL
jgi:uncharacterized protein DUF3237